jgi:hypothetical protein
MQGQVRAEAVATLITGAKKNQINPDVCLNTVR